MSLLSFLLIVYNQYNYQYFPIKPTMIENEVVSSTLIKNLLKVGDIEKANMLLGTEFFIQNIVEHGEKRGTSLGFPTANLSYPQNIIQIPYGVYSANIFNKKAVLNWGTKPTFENKKPVLEAHIIDFNENLYKKTLEIKLIKKIRDEIKFLNISELKEQIKKDIEEC